MKKGYLSEYFQGVAVKSLSAVEADSQVSHQHEFNSCNGLFKLLGKPDEKITFSVAFLYLCDDEEDRPSCEGGLTWYDARARARKERGVMRSEYRLYFNNNEVVTRMKPGDLFFLAKKSNNDFVVIIAEGESSIANQLLWLFGIEDVPKSSFVVSTEEQTDRKVLQYSTSFILNQLGIELHASEDYLEEMLRKFAGKFPTTREFSSFARSTCSIRDVRENTADQVLVAWMEQEEKLFFTFEHHILQERIRLGFEDVQDFIQTSLSAQNRRKSRAGSALENHFEEILKARGIAYTRGAKTEGRAKPDFLFPGEKEYHDPAFPLSSLFMLGVKSTCKDRWRQVLAEADKIENKHLLTFEPGISKNQTDEMMSKKLQLVVPVPIQSSYNSQQIDWLSSVEDFLSLPLNNAERH